MKKILYILIIFLLVFFIILLNKKESNKNSKLQKVKVAEVAHSIFYAPFYVAIENGYFEKYGIDLDLTLTSGADKVSTALLSGDVDIGFAGAEAAIYIYNGGEKNYFQVFSGLTKRDGQFIVGRKKEDNFTLESLKGKEVLVGRKGRMPALNFLNALDNAGIDYKLVDVNYQIDFASLSGAFIGGMGDYVDLFEPNATILEKNNEGYIVSSIGKYSGEMPYTCFFARRNYIEKNEKIIKNSVKAIDDGLNYINSHTSMEVAEVIHKQFPDNSVNDLSNMIENYKNADSWLVNSYVSKESFENLENVLLKNELIDSYVPYEKLVINYDEKK